MTIKPLLLTGLFLLSCSLVRAQFSCPVVNTLLNKLEGPNDQTMQSARCGYVAEQESPLTDSTYFDRYNSTANGAELLFIYRKANDVCLSITIIDSADQLNKVTGELNDKYAYQGHNVWYDVKNQAQYELYDADQFTFRILETPLSLKDDAREKLIQSLRVMAPKLKIKEQ